MVTDDEWRTRWREGRIGFHLPHVNPDLERWLPRLASSPTRVLVPLAGKSVDLKFLADLGHEVVGVELVEEAVRQLFAEAALPPTRDEEAGYPIYRGDGVEMHVADMLEVPAEALGLVGAIYDRAALIALPPEARKVYARRLVELLPSGCRMLLITLAYDDTQMEGPPFSVSDDEVRALYGAAGTLEVLDQRVAEDIPARARELGLTFTTTVWLFTRR